MKADSGKQPAPKKATAKFDLIRKNDNLNNSWRDSSTVSVSDNSDESDGCHDDDDDDDCIILEEPQRITSKTAKPSQASVSSGTSSTTRTTAWGDKSKSSDEQTSVDPTLGLRERLMMKMKIDQPGELDQSEKGTYMYLCKNAY